MQRIDNNAQQVARSIGSGEVAFARTLPPMPRRLLLRATSHSTKLNLHPNEIPDRESDATEKMPVRLEFRALSKHSDLPSDMIFATPTQVQNDTCMSGNDAEMQQKSGGCAVQDVLRPRPLLRHIRQPKPASQSERMEHITPSKIYEPQTFACSNIILTVPSSPEDGSVAVTPVAKTHVRPLKCVELPIDLPKGTIIDHKYEVQFEIARGGYGVVYCARQLGLDRKVAIKRLLSNDNASITQRFLLEANIIKNLIHPNTVQLLDAGAEEQHLYIVMEYIEGTSLYDVLRSEGALDVRRAMHITCQILKSINEAHQRNIIHRDLKPSNIMLRNVIGEKDFVKVLDFGIAKARYKNAPMLTQDSKVVGTPQYIAPELLFGDAPQPSADIYGIGLMLVEMLTGYPVMPPDIQSVVRFAASSEHIVLPETLVNSDLGPVIARALEKNPEKRYQSAEEMLADLQEISDNYQNRSQSSTYPKPSPHRSSHSYYTKLYKLALIAVLLIFTNVLIVVRFIL